MLEVKVTTSMQTITFMLDVPVSDKIDLHYDGCLYCDHPFRREAVQEKGRKFCDKPSHRVTFSQKKLAELTASC